uniref:Uncharacterized protein n=1 Tax=viral metagenome TaxID=1070528 RepID=A0A6H1Z9Y8_9ZZZZ
MRILEIAPKDIHIVIDLSKTEVEKILKALDHSEISYDGKTDPETLSAAEYVKKEFYPKLAEVLKELNHGS